MTHEDRTAAIVQLRGGIDKYKQVIKSLENKIKDLQKYIDGTEVEKRIRIVCEATGIPQKDVFSKSRKAEIVEARHLLCYLLNKDLTTMDVGKVMGLDHSTVVHAVKKIKDLLSINDKRIVELVNKVENHE